LGKDVEAESTYTASIDGKRRVQGEAHPSTLLTELRFAQMLQKRGRYAESEAQLLRAQAALTAAGSGADAQRSKQIAEQLAALYTAWGRPTKTAIRRE
jgi:hypothetical protein